MMKKLIVVILLVSGGLIAIRYVASRCGDTWQQHSADTVTGDCTYALPGREGNTTITKHWRIFWTDGYERLDTQVEGKGACKRYWTEAYYCDPRFDAPSWEVNTSRSGNWIQRVTDGYIEANSEGNPVCTALPTRSVYARHSCPTSGGGDCLTSSANKDKKFPKFEKEESSNICSECYPNPWEVQECFNSGGNYNYTYCDCWASPIVIDISGNGFNLTNAQNGVTFDLKGNNQQAKWSWTSANSDDAWLALDRNGNGTIDNGTELFGNNTPQGEATGEKRNGFAALAVYDKSAAGGNGNDVIDAGDNIFTSLRLWQDKDHNGISEANELHTLSDLGVAILELKYHESRKTDEHGNQFRYRAKVKDVHGEQVGRWAWDVYLRGAPRN